MQKIADRIKHTAKRMRHIRVHPEYQKDFDDGIRCMNVLAVLFEEGNAAALRHMGDPKKDWPNSPHIGEAIATVLKDRAHANDAGSKAVGARKP